ncbi:MAG TPA: tRNA (adenosine(37)-N6)-threonylcarbamoyltransferase complex ATPase subunit type 1 TsaE [Marmoricola sp.]|nr:tRNA (adenosine(37)-N6)-threonylcarbamoyltransferase complex ATPase subunit type 1 TsaE [Marmoricola sp.]
MSPAVVVREAGVDDAALVVDLIHRAFATRPVLDPPATAMNETEASVAEALENFGGLIADLDGVPVGSLLFAPEGPRLWLRRVGVLAEVREHGIAHLLTAEAARHAARSGFDRLVLEARVELPQTVHFWTEQGYVEVDRDGPRLQMVRPLPLQGRLSSLEETQGLASDIAALTRPGDVLLLSGDLGAGKTTFTQGFGVGLGVRGPITSPTFVIARTHPSLISGPALVHVDAYRLPDSAELDDLDLDTDLDTAVTVVEWGEGIAEQLSDDRLEITLIGGADESRGVLVRRLGARWADAGFENLASLTPVGDLS